MKKKIFLILFFFLFFAKKTFANEVLVFPKVIEAEAFARELLEFKIKIKNEKDTLFHFYTFVEDLKESSEKDKSNSLASWVEIFRSRTEILPYQEKEIPLKITIPFYAKPGNYFAQIVFAQGATEIDAKERAKKEKMPTVLLNIKVKENVVEKLQVKKFQTEKNFYFSKKIKFLLEIENIGNKEVFPKAKIVIYGKQGKEISEIKIDQRKILPQKREVFEISWECPKSLGFFKAVLFGEYQDKVFQESTFFWVFSLKYLLALFCFLIFVLILISWRLSKKMRVFSKKFFSETINLRKKFLIFLCFSFLFFSFGFCQQKLNLTLTPPLIKINLSPGQEWESSIKVINNNPFDVEVFVSVIDFRAGKEGGVEFLPKETSDKSFLLSQWIEVPKESISILAYQSKNIPFKIKVPQDAPPGGHYAAILVGKAPSQEISGSAIKVKPLVSCLVLAKIRGEILEKIWIREFSTDKTFYQKPKVEFTLKIENVGNVHVQPQGEIKIFNIFGKERGKISFNQKTEFGNVLPQSLRTWKFSWESKDSFEFGKYKAQLTLNYGEESKKTEQKTISFWIVPLAPTLFMFLILISLFLTIYLLVRLYVKRTVSQLISQIKPLPKIERKKTLVLFGKEGKKILEMKEEKEKVSKKYLFLLIFFLILGLLFLLFYFKSFLKKSKNYEVQTQKIEKENLPQAVFETAKKEAESVEKKEGEKEKIDLKSFSIAILNGTIQKGLANKISQNLKKEGFQIERVGNAENFNYSQTELKYKKSKQKEAEFLKNFLKKEIKLVEVEESSQKEDLILILGKDFTF